MSKIEELTEILVNEINDFNQGITKLEKINDQICTTKIRIDLAEYKSIIEKHQKGMKEQINSQGRFENRFESLLKTAKVYPNWAVIVFIISILISFTLLFYAFTLKMGSDNLEKSAYDKGVKTYNAYVKEFFKENPRARKDFEKWGEKLK